MESSLTLSVLLFLLFVYFPGNFFMVLAGRKQETRTVSACVYYGTVIIVLMFVFQWILLYTGKSNMIERFVYALRAASTGQGQLDLPAIGVIFIAVYLTSAILGLIELFLSTNIYVPPKWISKTFNYMYNIKFVRSVLNFFSRITACLRGMNTNVRIKPDNALLRTFINFRKAGKRPQVKIVLKNGSVVSGECLYYTWNGTESVLLHEMDNPSKLEWVSLQDVDAVTFLNLTFLEESEKIMHEEEKIAESSMKRLEDIKKSRQILNGLVPGYGNEVYGKIQKNLENSS